MKFYVFAITQVIAKYDSTIDKTFYETNSKQSLHLEEDFPIAVMLFDMLPFKRKFAIDVLNKVTGDSVEIRSSAKFDQWKRANLNANITDWTVRYYNTYMEGASRINQVTAYELQELDMSVSSAPTAKIFFTTILDEDTQEVLFRNIYEDFDKLKDDIFAQVNPDHPKFDPSGVCVNCDYRVNINSIEATAYFDGEANCELVAEGDAEETTIVFKRELRKNPFGL